MICASNCTTPSSFGSPPYPTDVSFGSSSVTLADFSMASNSSPFFLKISHPGFKTFLPHCSPRLQRIIGLFFLTVFDFPNVSEVIAGSDIPSAEIDLINFLRSIIF